MTTPTFFAPLDGDLDARDGDGDVTLTAVGAARFVTAEAGPYPARFNYIANPRAENGTAYTNLWAPANVASEVDATVRYNGHKTFKVTAGDTGDREFFGHDNGNPVGSNLSPRTFTASAMVLAPAGADFDFRARVFTDSGDYQTIVPVVGTGDWAYLTATVTTASGGTGTIWGIRTQIKHNGPDPAVFWITDMQFEEGDEATPYFDGSMGDGYVSTGTLWESASYREPWAGGSRALLVEEAVTNTIRNPFGWFNTSAIQDYSGASVDAAYTGRPDLAPRCVKITTLADGQPNKGVNYEGENLSEAGGSEWIGSVDIVGTGSVRVWLSSRYSDASEEQGPQGSYVVLDPDTPQRIPTAVMTTNAAKTLTRVELQVRNDGDVGDVFYIAYAHAQRGDYLTTPCPEINRDGSLPTGYTWSGSAHDSPSSRAAGYATVPIDGLPSTEGSIAVRFRFPEDGFLPTILGINYDGGADDKLYLRAMDDAMPGRLRFCTARHDTGDDFDVTRDGFTPGEWYTVYGEWDLDSVGMTDPSGTLITDIRGATAGTFGGQPLVIGTRLAGPDRYGNTAIGSVLAFDRKLTASEWARLESAAAWSWTVLAALGLADIVVGGSSRLAGAPVIAGSG